MHSFRSRMAAFMAGRYGIDQLYFGLLGLYLFLAMLRILIPFSILSWLGFAVLIFATFRMLSKNIPARRRENEWFLKVWRPVKSRLILCRDRIRDRKTCRYRRCHHCHAILRLPVRRGKNTVRCPKCGESFSVRIF